MEHSEDDLDLTSSEVEIDIEEDEEGLTSVMVLGEDIEMEEIRPEGRREKKRKTYSYAWLSKISTINLDLCGTDLNQRIELSCPGGPVFKTDLQDRKDENGSPIRDQKQFNVFNSKNEKLLTIDLSKDRKSFHIMEPDSSVFIAFFTINEPSDGGRIDCIDIHNVIDGETYQASKTAQENSVPARIVIKSEKGEEIGTISKPAPKWTQFLTGTMTLNFTGDEREGLTTREKAIILGFLVAMGVLGMDYWKRSSTGLLTFYIFCIIFFALLVIFIYYRVQNDLQTNQLGKTGNSSSSSSSSSQIFTSCVIVQTNTPGGKLTRCS